jgi:hypothetical protein
MKIIPLESRTFEVSSDIYFVVYDLYYVGQNNDLGTRTGPIHRDGGITHDDDGMFIGGENNKCFLDRLNLSLMTACVSFKPDNTTQWS